MQPQQNKRFSTDPNIIEIATDEVGRGCLFGRVYAAAVILPNDFDATNIKDSKKFTNKKKLREVAERIKKEAISWSIAYESETVIDEINILQASQRAMHRAIRDIVVRMSDVSTSDVSKNVHLLVDGNYFKPFLITTPSDDFVQEIPHTCIEGGDAQYTAISAASIIAKTARDDYILEMCAQNPSLNERYGLATNMGYGTKKHMEGIKTYGITEFHRKSFGPCSAASVSS